MIGQHIINIGHLEKRCNTGTFNKQSDFTQLLKSCFTEFITLIYKLIRAVYRQAARETN